MAYTAKNRLLVVRLYSGSINGNNYYLANVSPRNLVLNSGDNLFIVVELPGNGTGTYTGSLSFNTALGAYTTYIGGTQGASNSLGDIISLGTVGTFNTQTNDTYTISIAYNGQTYSEDPQIQVNPD